MNKKIFIPGLNELRCVAAICVLLGHIEIFKKRAHIPNIYDYPYIKSIGYHGVLLFFVLSGFLITYLSLHELNRTDSINIRFFYARRALRIWPLYILCIVIAYVAIPSTTLAEFFNFYIPQSGEFISVLWQTIFVPNYLLFQTGSILGVGILWSIAMEEQFYLIQPHLLKRLHKNLSRNLIIITALIFIARFALYKAFIYSNYDKIYLSLFRMLGFEPLLIGSIFAAMYFEKQLILKLFFKKTTQYFTFTCLVITLYFKEFYHPFTELIFGFFYAVIIINTVSSHNAILKFNNRLMAYLGQISFGIYMLHSFVLAFVIFWSHRLTTNIFFSNILFYIGSILITLICAHFSYKYFETFFVKLKDKVTIIESSNIGTVDAPNL